MATAKEAAKWSAEDWRSKVTFARPSGGGAIGVMFIWTTPNAILVGGKTCYQVSETADFVLKPLGGSAASTLMAEEVLSKVAGAASPGTKVVASGSAEGGAILATLGKYQNQGTDKTRWENVWPTYLQAKTFLLAENQVGVKELQDSYKDGMQLTVRLMQDDFLKNLGMLIVADVIIGNGDRLWNMNTGNIMFKATGQIVAIDSATILTNFEALVNATVTADSTGKGSPWGSDDGLGVLPKADQRPKAWGKNQTSSTYGDNTIGGVAPSFTVESLWRLDDWWENTFKKHLMTGQTDGARKVAKDDPMWDWAKADFMTGVNDGMAKLDTMLSSKWNWLQVKSKLHKLSSKYGVDPNLDYLNFKVRRKYYRLRRAGKSQAEAEDAVAAYVTRKVG